jgi:hypothetical protein
MSPHKSLSFLTILGTFVLLLLFAIAASGCGASAGAVAPSPTPAAPAAQKCGTIGVRPGGNGTTNPPGGTKADVAGNCFWQAFQQCRAASLVVNFGGIDTITTHTFTLQKKNAACAISDAVQHRVIPQPARDGGIFTCSGLVNAANELHFSGCGTNGDIVVPIGKS